MSTKSRYTSRRVAVACVNDRHNARLTQPGATRPRRGVSGEDLTSDQAAALQALQRRVHHRPTTEEV
jgi:hypothetical protein